MFEKVNPSHPDKLCDRIGGAIVDLGYNKMERPRIAGECLLGHGNCHIIIETNVDYTKKEIEDIVHRIAGNKIKVDLKIVPQDKHLAKNQEQDILCGDNGIFKGCLRNEEEFKLSMLTRALYDKYPYDGKYVYDEKDDKLIACQSNVKTDEFKKDLHIAGIKSIITNPLGDWTGGPDVDTGACNRKLGSDMGRAVTGGGLHFKDISKADVAVNIYLFLKCIQLDIPELTCKCAIGDADVIINGRAVGYNQITSEAMEYIYAIGGFEKLAEWGLV